MSKDCRVEIALEVGKLLPDVPVAHINRLVDKLLVEFASSARDMGYDIGNMRPEQFVAVLGASDQKAVFKAVAEHIDDEAARDILRHAHQERAKNQGLTTIYSMIARAADKGALADGAGAIDRIGKVDAVSAMRDYMLIHGDAQYTGNIAYLMGPLQGFFDKNPAVLHMVRSFEGTSTNETYRSFMREVLEHMFDPKLVDSAADTPSRELAQIIRGTYDKSLELLNAQGLFMRDRKAYVPNHHSQERMLIHGEEAWIDAVVRNIDREKSFGGKLVGDETALRDRLKEIYRSMIDRYEKRAVDQEAGTELFRVDDDFHKRFEMGADMVFRDADAWLDYHSQFGSTMDPLHAMNSAVRQRGRAAAVFKLFGPMPVQGAMDMKNALADALRGAIEKRPDGFVLDIPNKRVDLERLDAFDVRGGRRVQGDSLSRVLAPEDGGLSYAFAEFTGETFSPKDAGVAKVMSIARGVKRWSSMGSAVLSSISDPGNIILSMASKGMGASHAMGEMLNQMAMHTQVRNGIMKAAAEKVGLDVSRMEGAFDHFPIMAAAFEGLAADVHALAHGDNAASVAKFDSRFFRWTGLTGWTDFWKGVAQRTNMVWLGEQAHRGFQELPTRMQYSLQSHGIGSAQWEAMRLCTFQGPDGRVYLMPDMVQHIPGDTLRSIAANIKEAPANLPAEVADGIRATQVRWKNDPEVFRRDLLGNFIAFLTDEVRSGVIEQDARTRYFLLRGSQPGTVGGETLRLLAMFRSFPMGVLDRVNRMANNLPPGDSFKMDVAKWAAMGIVLGYVSQWLNDVAQGYTPRSIVGDHFGGSFLGALRKTSVFGPYGDALLSIYDGPKSRPFVVNAINAVGGPAVSTGTDALAVLYAGVQSDKAWAHKAFRFMLQNTPGQNVWWARAAFDISVVRHIENFLYAPARTKRFESNEKMAGRTALLPK